MIDLHAHIPCPGSTMAPHRSRSPSTSRAQAVAAGARVLAAKACTCQPHVPEPIRGSSRNAWPRCARRFGDAGVALEVSAQGGELAPTRVAELDDETLRDLSLGGGPYLLFECPFSPRADDLEQLIYDLQDRGWRILLAHPERSGAFHRSPGRLARLVTDGALVQVTAGALAGQFGQTARRFSVDALREGLVHVLARRPRRG